MTIKFSVIMPIYNSERTLKQSIQSVLNQTYDNYELIVINDGSTDGSYDLIQTIHDDRIVYVEQMNGGVSSARNQGIAKAQGEFLVFVDSDDCVAPDILSSYYSILNSSNQDTPIDMIISKYTVIKGNTTTEFITPPKIRSGLLQVSDLNTDLEYWYRSMLLNAPVSKCYRTSVIQTLFPQGVSYGEDLMFNLSNLNNMNYIYFLDQSLYLYRMEDPNSLSARYHENGFDTLNQVLTSTLSHVKTLWGEVNPMVFYCKYVKDYMDMIEKMVLSQQYHRSELMRMILYHFNQMITLPKRENLIQESSPKTKLYYQLINRKHLQLLIFVIKTKSVLLKHKRHIPLVEWMKHKLWSNREI